MNELPLTRCIIKGNKNVKTYYLTFIAHLQQCEIKFVNDYRCIYVLRNVVYRSETTMFRGEILTLFMTENLTKENPSRYKMYF